MLAAVTCIIIIRKNKDCPINVGKYLTKLLNIYCFFLFLPSACSS